MDIQAIDVNSWLNSNEVENLQQVQNNWNKIPLLNVQNPQDLQVNKLVRFKGMIQDMFNPEYYYETYEVVNKETKEKHVLPGKYRDTAVCDDKEYINFESKSNVTKDRQTFVLITAPGFNDWAINAEEQFHHPNKVIEAPAVSTSTKRSMNDEDEQPETTSMEVDSTTACSKKQCTNSSNPETENKSVVSVDHLLNMPLPGRSGKACHLKVYEKADNLKLNELIDCVGFLSMEGLYQEGANDGDDNEDETLMELQTHHPPPSLIPKIHCIAFKQVVDSSPLYEESNNMSGQELQTIKKELEIVLTQLLLGDKLAAEYLIYHLISKVYNRFDLMVLGKFTYNISNVPTCILSEYGAQVYAILEKLITKSHYLPMTLDNMNDLAFIPKKDYDCNRITSGILQLSSNTHLVLDETKLTTGKMNSSGVQAVGAISEIIKNQRSHYDFNYYKMDFDCDIAFLILSEGKSLLPSDVHVPLRPEDAHITTFEEILAALNVYLKPELLTSIRKYIANRRHAVYEITDNIHEVVQNEFVNMRANQNATAEDLHSLLVLSRFICLADGKSVLDESCWRRACQLEQERKARLQN